MVGFRLQYCSFFGAQKTHGTAKAHRGRRGSVFLAVARTLRREKRTETHETRKWPVASLMKIPVVLVKRRKHCTGPSRSVPRSRAFAELDRAFAELDRAYGVYDTRALLGPPASLSERVGSRKSTCLSRDPKNPFSSSLGIRVSAKIRFLRALPERREVRNDQIQLMIAVYSLTGTVVVNINSSLGFFERIGRTVP